MSCYLDGYVPFPLKWQWKQTKQNRANYKFEPCPVYLWVRDLPEADQRVIWENFQAMHALKKNSESHVLIWIHCLEQFIGLVYANSLFKISYILLNICVLSNFQYSGTCSVSSLESQKETFSTTHLNMHVSVIWTYWVKQDEQCFFLKVLHFIKHLLLKPA